MNHTERIRNASISPQLKEKALKYPHIHPFIAPLFEIEHPERENVIQIILSEIEQYPPFLQITRASALSRAALLLLKKVGYAPTALDVWAHLRLLERDPEFYRRHMSAEVLEKIFHPDREAFWKLLKELWERNVRVPEIGRKMKTEHIEYAITFLSPIHWPILSDILRYLPAEELLKSLRFLPPRKYFAKVVHERRGELLPLIKDPLEALHFSIFSAGRKIHHVKIEEVLQARRILQRIAGRLSLRRALQFGTRRTEQLWRGLPLLRAADTLGVLPPFRGDVYAWVLATQERLRKKGEELGIRLPQEELRYLPHYIVFARFRVEDLLPYALPEKLWELKFKHYGGKTWLDRVRISLDKYGYTLGVAKSLGEHLDALLSVPTCVRDNEYGLAAALGPSIVLVARRGNRIVGRKILHGFEVEDELVFVPNHSYGVPEYVWEPLLTELGRRGVKLVSRAHLPAKSAAPYRLFHLDGVGIISFR